ncbi:penicillin-binding transpeptidase domain-containing protein [Corynebacterium choanae]|uniref:Penicillin-binding protein A n=1 Tax=Corynebacterium choanae TaxID=1862358 RepID=A0A3G6J6V9_9CORY|nr:penicillin-binding transpeptidase domain-containing protein [Corynebacterium choanae]AZA13845.1 Penicillin-binding protein A [Corynebacterium choanae]
MQRVVSALMVVLCLVAGVACTPKPPQPDPVAEDFAAALSAEDFSAAGAFTDDPQATESLFQASAQGLQAESLSMQLADITGEGQQVTARFTIDWALPGDRHFSYDTQALMTQTAKQWQVRIKPSVVHPQLGAGQHLELRGLPAKRASVVAADGRAVLNPGMVYRILLNAQITPNPALAAAEIAAAFEQARANHGDAAVPPVDPRELSIAAKAVNGPYSVAVLGEAPGKQVAQALAGVQGVVVNEEADLVATDPNFAPEIIGRVKQAVATDVEGERGWLVASVNEHGAVIDTLTRNDPSPAPAIAISLDPRMQQAAQAAVDLRQEMKTMMVVIRPSTGAILAVAQTGRADEDGPVALMGQYPPGSTFKIITATAGMERQGVTPGSIVPCPGTMDIGHRIVTNYNAFSLGSVPLLRAFASSCNTTFADISARLAPGELKSVAAQFGLGRDYHIQGLDTVTGQVPEGEELVDRTEAGFGQGKDLASPFGMALVAATAAHGATPEPYLIAGDHSATDPAPPAPAPEAIAQLQQMMLAVTQQGTARGMRAAGDVYGKTGEAEIAGGSHAWFAGYRGDIAFATLIVLGGGSESAVAVTDHFLRALDEQGLG